MLDEPWTPVDTITSSIGQGAVDVTPLQMARLYAAVANGGWLVTPHLVERITPAQWIGLKPATLKVLHLGPAAGGHQRHRHHPQRPQPAAVAGKTGTGEDPPRPDHAWFGGYAPATGKPTLVIVAFGENCGGYGGTVAAPMVKALMTIWFRGAKAPPAAPTAAGAAEAKASGHQGEPVRFEHLAVVAPQLFGGAGPAPAFGFLAGRPGAARAGCEGSPEGASAAEIRLAGWSGS